MLMKIDPRPRAGRKIDAEGPKERRTENPRRLAIIGTDLEGSDAEVALGIHFDDNIGDGHRQRLSGDERELESDIFVVRAVDFVLQQSTGR